MFPYSRHRLNKLTFVFLGLCCLVAGCDSGDPPPLTLEDLTPDEYLYIQRFVTLERAKAVAVVDRPTGDALLDSLATAWGDSAQRDTEALAPGDPRRAKLVHQLLFDILDTEVDSLVNAPRPDRLHQPLPRPLSPEEKESREPDDGTEIDDTGEAADQNQ
jgi:hypothetical protein|nr:hypothetical protein [Candidatus Krumholzibacteria bacterium]